MTSARRTREASPDGMSHCKVSVDGASCQLTIDSGGTPFRILTNGPHAKTSMHVILGFQEETAEGTVHRGLARGLDLGLKLDDSAQITNLTLDLMSRYDSNVNE